MKVMKLTLSDWENASRDKRELSAYRELGAEVYVVAKGQPGDHRRTDSVSGFPVYRYSTRPLGAWAPVALQRVCAYLNWIAYTREEHADVITARNIKCLGIAWLSSLFQRKKPTLIYDSHEFEMGRNINRNWFQKKVVQYSEKFLMRRCAFSIMVNDTIADEVQRIHRLKERPVVVRSTPENWKLDHDQIRSERKSFEAELAKRGAQPSFLVMYHGIVVKGRGIELLIRAVAARPDTGLVILGNGNEAYLRQLRTLSADLNMSERVLFRPAVPQSELWKYVGAVDVDVAPIELVVKNHYFSLPNKFFESIQSLTPVVTAKVPEMDRIIRQYQIGLTFPAGDAEALGQCLERMRTDKVFYAACREHLKRAKDELCWEKEKEVLQAAFRRTIL